MQRRTKSTIAILAGSIAIVCVSFIAYRVFFGSIIDTRTDSTRHLVQYIADNFVEFYRNEKGRYPTTDEGLAFLVREGYLREVPRDAWGNELQYRYPSDTTSPPFALWSLGADGKAGGIGENADIANRGK